MLQRLYRIIIGLAAVWCIMGLMRIAFYLVNHNYFSIKSNSTLAWIFIHGMRFDASILVYILSIWMLAELLLNDTNLLNQFKKTTYIVPLILLIILEIIDIFYFPYSAKRLSIELFQFTTDIYNQLVSMASQYFYALILLLILLILFIKLITYVHKYIQITKCTYKNLYFILPLLIVILVIGRGGLQKRPLSPAHANINVTANQSLLVLNSSFNLLHTSFLKKIPKQHYFTDKELNSIYTIRRDYTQYTHPWKNKNIVLIVLESMSKEYIHYYNPQYNYTPFLDSIIKKSWHANHCYASSKQSVRGLSAILASLPALMEEPFIFSLYQSNSLQGIGFYLEQIGYHTSFYHGAANGSFNFNLLAAKTGIKKYYGKNEYPKPLHFDGNWGIWDHYFITNWVAELNTTAQPFFSCLFSLNNHHPYTLPPGFDTIIPYSEHKILRTVAYTDSCLALFFDQAKNTSWYNNSIFIITADHTGLPLSEWNNTIVGMYEIPLLIYDPQSPQEKIYQPVIQQIDIMPTVLHNVGYSAPFYSFGKSIADSLGKSPIAYTIPINQIIDNTFVLQTDGNIITQIDSIDWENKKLHKRFAPPSSRQLLLLKQWQAIMQVHYERMTKNKLDQN